jgi:plastocyanin
LIFPIVSHPVAVSVYRVKCTDILASCLVLIAGVTLANGQAVIEGQVSLPKPEPWTSPAARYAGQAAEIAPPDPPRAVVYLEGQFPKNPAETQVTNEVAQAGAQFRPALLPVQVGTSVIFPNDDDFYHNVFSYSKPKRFDLGRYRKTDRSPMVVFDTPGVVKLYCEIHQHMRGVILVLDTPYFARTQTNGTYRLSNLPPGHFQLKAWLDEKHVYETAVDLAPGQSLHVDFPPR